MVLLVLRISRRDCFKVHICLISKFASCTQETENLCLYLDFVCNTHMNLYNKSFLCIILVDWHHSGINSNLSLLFFLFFFGKMYLWLFFGFCRFCGWFIIFWEGCLCCSLFGDIQGFKPLTFATEFSGIA